MRETSPRNDARAFAWLCAMTIAVSAFLLFELQPIISKTILPWFGGTPAVWTTCLLFFQVLLLAGYGYAHALISLGRPSRAVLLHVPLLVVAACLLPITPSASWKPDAIVSPASRILLLLLVSVGLPYFLLASTGPLVQAWFAWRYPNRSAYRLYALSNAGSLLALLSYPFVVEPSMATQTQCWVWSAGFGVFALLCGGLSLMLWRTARCALDRSSAVVRASPGQQASTDRRAPLTWTTATAWLLLPALASMMLLAVTNHLCQRTVVVPFLWIAPLSIYLVSFIICFQNECWYVRRWFGLLAAISVLAVCNMLLSFSVDELYEDIGINFQLTVWRSNIVFEGGLILLMFFLATMVCHGELVRRKPDPSRLTSFYLMVAAGGALGGVFVALICPLVFNAYWEFKLGLFACFLVACVTVFREGGRRWFIAFPSLKWVNLLFGAAGLYMISSVNLGADVGIQVRAERNFYGVHSVRALLFNEPHRSGLALYHGNTMHGYQYQSDGTQSQPTLYYEPGSGVGIILSRFPRQGGLRVGVIGLGVGTLAAYGQSGDTYRFYEIDPDVIQLCRQYFTFVDESKATVEIVEGDARLLLEQESPQHFDVLVIDAFSDDAIPTHLLSKEAFEVYLRHLKPSGVLAFHLSNRYLNLGVVVQRLADHFRLPTRYVVHSPGVMMIERPPSIWMLVSDNKTLLNDRAVLEKTFALPGDWRSVPIWTDHYSSLRNLLW